MTGVPSDAFSRARWKMSRMCRSVSPTYLLSSSGPLMLRKNARPSGFPVTSVDDLLEHDDVTLALELQRLHDVERLVEHDLLAAAQRLGVDVGADDHAQLAAAGEDVDGAVLVLGEEDAVAARRLGQPLD